MYEPPPQAEKFTWVWRKWINGLYEYISKPVITIVEDADMSNSWVNFDATRKVRYWKDALGVVHLSGVIKSGTITAAAFTLPVGFRPENVASLTANFPVTSNALFGEVTISDVGVVTPSVGSNVSFYLDGITFKAA